MKHWYLKPNKLLAEYVKTILIMEGFCESTSNNLPVFTSGMAALFFQSEKTADNLEEITELSLYNQTPADIWTVKEQSTIVAFFFNPFSIAPLFNISAKELSEKPFELNKWSPHKYTALKTQLIYATDTNRKIEVLDNLLIQQQRESSEAFKIVQYATDQLLKNSGKEIMTEIIGTLNISERTFQRIFKKYVGIPPTQYRRLCQFQESIGQLREKQFDKISEVAYDNGFADQSHFIRSFKEFTQITPNDYIKRG